VRVTNCGFVATIDDGQGMSLQSIISGGVNEVGTITPVQDFKNMLTRKDVDLVDTGTLTVCGTILIATCSATPCWGETL
jgi:hypothetical protein